MLKATYWHSKNRKALFRRTKPAAVWSLTWRPDFLGKGRPTMDVMWCVWRRGNEARCAYDLLDRP